MHERTAFRAVPKPGAGPAFPSAQQQAGAEDSPGVEVSARLLASRANEQEIARAARKISRHAAEEIVITLGLPRFQSGRNYFQRTARVDFDAGSLFDFPGRAPPDQHAERRVVEHPPYGRRGQARDGLAVDAQAASDMRWAWSFLVSSENSRLVPLKTRWRNSWSVSPRRVETFLRCLRGGAFPVG